MTALRPIVAGLVLLLTGCSYDPERFEEDYLDAFCDYQNTCDPPLFPSDARCRESESGDREELVDCTLDEDQARACIDALSRRTCEGAASNFPAACQPDATHACGEDSE